MSLSVNLLKRSIFYLAVGLLAKAVLTERKQKKTGNRKAQLNYDGKSVLHGIFKAYQSPFNCKKKDLFISGAFVSGIAVIFLYDEALSNWFRQQEEKAHPILKDFGWYYGSPENHYAINGGFYLFGLLTRNEKVRKTGVLLISASSAAGIFQTIAKTIIGRARPLKNVGKAFFRPFSRENAYYSFPSGHSILSFTTAYALGRQFNDPILKCLIYAFGSIAPFSRLWAGAHWVTDAVTSICISIPLVNTIDDYLEKERNYKSGLDT